MGSGIPQGFVLIGCTLIFYVLLKTSSSKLSTYLIREMSEFLAYILYTMKIQSSYLLSLKEGQVEVVGETKPGTRHGKKRGRSDTVRGNFGRLWKFCVSGV